MVFVLRRDVLGAQGRVWQQLSGLGLLRFSPWPKPVFFTPISLPIAWLGLGSLQPTVVIMAHHPCGCTPDSQGAAEESLPATARSRGILQGDSTHCQGAFLP